MILPKNKRKLIFSISLQLIKLSQRSGATESASSKRLSTSQKKANKTSKNLVQRYRPWLKSQPEERLKKTRTVRALHKRPPKLKVKRRRICCTALTANFRNSRERRRIRWRPVPN